MLATYNNNRQQINVKKTLQFSFSLCNTNRSLPGFVFFFFFRLQFLTNNITSHNWILFIIGGLYCCVGWLQLTRGDPAHCLAIQRALITAFFFFFDTNNLSRRRHLNLVP
uniref:Uncharacterized protein n=1 Tax=Physcomitrium patens TaxID=3218 RepID=A0A7I3ZMW8_PHYPA